MSLKQCNWHHECYERSITYLATHSVAVEVGRPTGTVVVALAEVADELDGEIGVGIEHTVPLLVTQLVRQSIGATR